MWVIIVSERAGVDIGCICGNSYVFVNIVSKCLGFVCESIFRVHEYMRFYVHVRVRACVCVCEQRHYSHCTYR